MKAPADETDWSDLLAAKSEGRAETLDDTEDLRNLLPGLILLQAMWKGLVRQVRIGMDEAKFSFFCVV